MNSNTVSLQEFGEVKTKANTNEKRIDSLFEYFEKDREARAKEKESLNITISAINKNLAWLTFFTKMAMGIGATFATALIGSIVAFGGKVVEFIIKNQDTLAYLINSFPL